MLDCSALPTSLPTVARQRTSTNRISPDGRRSVARLPPWRRAGRCCRPSGRSSRRRPDAAPQWIVVPTGMLRSGRLLPGLMSADPGLDRRALLQALRRDDVALLAVGVVQQRDPRGAVGVVLDVRDLGRHAVLVVATEVDDAVGALVTAPWCRVVIRPWLLRPPFLGSGTRVSDFSGVVRVISTKSATDEPRRPGVVGLYLRIAISLLSSTVSGRPVRRPDLRRCRCGGPRRG